MTILVRQDLFPVLVSISGGTMNDAQADEYFEILDGIYARKRPVVWLSVIGPMDPRAPALTRIASWMKDNRQNLAEHAKAMSFVASSAVFSFVLSGLFLVQPLPTPYRVDSKLDNGLRWLEGRCKLESIAFDRDAVEKFVESLPKPHEL